MSFITVREDFKDDNSTTVSILVKQISGTLLDTNLTLPCCKNSQVLYERLKISYVFNNIRMLLETEEFMLLRTNCICTNIYKSSRTKEIGWCNKLLDPIFLGDPHKATMYD